MARTPDEQVRFDALSAKTDRTEAEQTELDALSTPSEEAAEAAE